MFRHYYISDNLDDLEIVENQLEEHGVTSSQFHVLSEADAEVEQHHLHAIEAVLKQDVVHSMEWGAVAGLISGLAILFVTWALGWHTTAVGWMPFIFIAIVALGFCTWVGGFIGIQIPNYQFRRFQKLLKAGKHVFFVDVTGQQQAILKDITKPYDSLTYAGTGDATPEWVVRGQDKFHALMKTMP